MKKQLILLGLLLMVLCGFAQDNWFKTIESSNYQHPIGDIFIKNGEYYFAVVESYSSQTYNEYYSLIYKVTEEGSIQSSGIIDNNHYNQLGTMCEMENGNILAIGHYYLPEEDDIFALWQLEFDENLSVVEEKIDTINIGFAYLMNSFRDELGDVFFHQVQGRYPFDLAFDKTYLARISEDKIIQKDTLFDVVSFDISTDFTSEEDIIIFTYQLDETEELKSNQINILDKDFQLQNTPISWDGGELCTFLSIHNGSDSNYYCNAFHFSDEGYWLDSSASAKIDSNFQMIHFQNFDTTGFWFHSPNHNGIDTYGEYVYAGGNFNYHGQNQYSPNYFSLVIMDTSLQILKKRFYGGDANYMLNSIKATPNGDVLLLGHCSDLGDNV